MLRIDRRLLQNVDWILIGAAVVLIGLGLLSIWSLAPAGASSSLAWRQISLPMAPRHSR